MPSCSEHGFGLVEVAEVPGLLELDEATIVDGILHDFHLTTGDRFVLGSPEEERGNLNLSEGPVEMMVDRLHEGLSHHAALGIIIRRAQEAPDERVAEPVLDRGLKGSGKELHRGLESRGEAGPQRVGPGTFGFYAGRTDEHEPVDRRSVFWSARHIEANASSVGMADHGDTGLNLFPDIVVEDLCLFRDAPRLWGWGRGPVTGQIYGVGPICIGESLSEGTHVLNVASPPMQQKDRRGLRRPAHLYIQPVARHENRTSDEESNGRLSRETISI